MIRPGQHEDNDAQRADDHPDDSSPQTEELMEDLVRHHSDSIRWLDEAKTKADGLLAETGGACTSAAGGPGLRLSHLTLCDRVSHATKCGEIIIRPEDPT